MRFELLLTALSDLQQTYQPNIPEYEYTRKPLINQQHLTNQLTNDLTKLNHNNNKY